MMSDRPQQRKKDKQKQKQPRSSMEDEEQEVLAGLNLQLGDLDLTSQEIDFDEVDGDLLRFQKDDIVRDALHKGVDLRQYSRQIEQELREAETMCVNDYVRESADLAKLHLQIKGCDGILETMQDMLGSFQADLGTISSEIKHLQEKSMTMNVELRNRKQAGEALTSFVENAFITEELAQAICQAPVNEQYVQHLMQLSGKIKFLRQSEQRNARAIADMLPVAEKLKLKAIGRIREFCLEKIHDMRKPKTNIQIKQNLLLKYKYFYEFILDHHQYGSGPAGSGSSSSSSPLTSSSAASSADGSGSSSTNVAAEIRQSYMEGMTKRYYGHFKSYLSSMKKLTDSSHKVDKQDLLGTDESKTGGLFSSKKTTQHMNRVFNYADRGRVLELVGTPPIIAHVEEQRKAKFPFEFTFRSSTHLLMDTATAEYAFLEEFYGRSHDPSDDDQALKAKQKERTNTAHQMFTRIFAKTISMFLENLEDYLFSCYDSLGLLTMIRIVYQHNKIMQQRRVHCLDAFFDRVNMLLWPRFKTVFDANVDSVQRVRQSTPNLRPHYVSWRYAQYAAAILQLNEGYNDDIILSNLARLRTVVERLLLSMATGLGAPKSHQIFLINNYDLILSVIRGKDVREAKEIDRFEELLSAQTAQFVEEELKEKFGDLVSFVKQSEFDMSSAGSSSSSSSDAAALASASASSSGSKTSQRAKIDTGKASRLIRQFTERWQDGIERLCSSVSKSFSQHGPGAGAGPEILKQVLVQLVLYYQRFQEIINQCAPALAKDLLPIRTIMYEIKKYTKKYAPDATN